MADHEKKILKALVAIAKEMEKLDKTLDKLDSADGKLKHFYEQEKVIHEIKKIAHKADKVEHYEEKDAEKWAHKIAVDIDGQVKALMNIANAADKLEEELDKIDDDAGKVKSFVAQRKMAHQVKKILHNCGLFEKYTEDELERIL